MEASDKKRKLFQLMARLNSTKLDKRGQLEDAVAALIILDPTHDHRHVIKFLTKRLTENGARSLVKRQEAKVDPFSFHFLPHLGWVVWAAKEGDNVVSVPCVVSQPDRVGDSEEGGDKGLQPTESTEIRAFVAVGDQICLPSARPGKERWGALGALWTVHELRPQSNSLLLISKSHNNLSHDENCQRQRQARGVRPRVQYKECHPLALAGCTIRRSVCVTCFKRFLYTCECDDEQQHHHHSCVFLFPSPDSSAAEAHLQGLLGSSDAFHLLDGGEDIHDSDEHVYRMQREAGVSIWLEQKRVLAQVEAAMRSLPAFLSRNSTAWLAVGRILRSLSGPGNQHSHVLLSLWQAWTSSSAPTPGHRGRRHRPETPDCSAVWAAMRPPTNCDETAIVRAREYLQHCLQGSGGDVGADLMARSIIADADVILQNASLEFWADSESSSPVSAGKPRRRAALGGGGKQVVAPAAVYSYDAEALVAQHLRGVRAHDEHMGGGDKSSGGSMARGMGQFEELSQVVAAVGPESVLGIREGGVLRWLRVRRVDLLFARLEVCACHPPPLSWLHDKEEEEEWLPVSKLWFALVCSRVESYMGTSRYSIFTAPQPDAAASLRALEDMQRAPQPSPGEEVADSLLGLTVLHCDASSVTVSWQGPAGLYNDDNFREATRCSRGGASSVVSVRLSREGNIGKWQEVYRGGGKGCNISHLQSGSCYHVRLASSCGSASQDESSHTSTSYIMAHTTSA